LGDASEDFAHPPAPGFSGFDHQARIKSFRERSRSNLELDVLVLEHAYGVFEFTNAARCVFVGRHRGPPIADA
jgi:hypothetical protein